MHLILTRPEPDATAWRHRLEALGARVSVEPLLAIELIPPAAETVDAAGLQGMIITSRNALRALEAAPQTLAGLAGLRLFVVGPATAARARSLGFQHVEPPVATAADLVSTIRATCAPGAGPLLHLSGDKVAVDLTQALAPAGLRIERRVVYRSRPAEALRPETVKVLADGSADTVMLMSPLTAKTFLELTTRAGVGEQCQRLVYVCLSQTIAGILSPLSPRAIHIAQRPDAEAMFTLIDSLLA